MKTHKVIRNCNFSGTQIPSINGQYSKHNLGMPVPECQSFWILLPQKMTQAAVSN